MSENNTLHSQLEFLKKTNQIRKSIGSKLLSTEELLYVTADEIAHSYTMNEGKATIKGDSLHS